MPSQDVVDFIDVFRAEVAVINARRASQTPPRPAITLVEEATDSAGHPIVAPHDDANVVGLALSGGGVRSASFCLGALQALNEANVLDRVDYLSTVSGGGYVGCSLSAGLESAKGEFPFESRTLEDETPSMQHLRDYSNYLFPQGAIDVLHNASIYVRGLIANFVLIMPFLLIAAAVTIFLNPTVGALNYANVPGFQALNIFNFEFFVVTAYLSLILLVLGVAWGLLRSFKSVQNTCEVPSNPTRFIGWVVLVVFFSAFCELQPFVLAAMFNTKAGDFFGASVFSAASSANS
jgi:hypothetical protein